MSAVAPGQTRGLSGLPPPPQRHAAAGRHGVRAVGLGLFFILAACARPSPEQAAGEADARYGTQGFAWLAAHDPSALVAWGIPPDELRPIAPDARVEAARTKAPCAEALSAHAALFVVVPRGAEAEKRRSAALDCGVALYRDARVLVIAPR